MKKMWLVALAIVIAITGVLPVMGAPMAQEPEPVYSLEWGAYDCLFPTAWVGLKFVHPFLRKEDIQWTVLYIQKPGWTKDTRVFDYTFGYTSTDGNEVHIMDAIYSHPQASYSLKACVVDKYGVEYCTESDLKPICPEQYLPAIFG